MNELTTTFQAVREASRLLAFYTDEQVNNLLVAVANETEKQSDVILRANSIDLDRMGTSNPKYDRLKLTKERIAEIAEGIRTVATLPTPIGRVLNTTIRPNGMRLKKVAVSFGVIGVIYEARPNVTLDVFSLCLKSGNACLLKGGTDAYHSNSALVEVIHTVLNRMGLSTQTVALLPPDAAATTQLLEARGYVDLLIPRGGRGLIDFVRQHATIPVIETGAGVCHTYFDVDGDLLKGAAIVNNAKTRRVTVCNTMDCLLIHQERITQLPQLCEALATQQVIIYADEMAYVQLQGNYPDALLQQAEESHFGTEFLDYKMAIKTVQNVEEATAHIAVYGLGHSECIITENQTASDYFVKAVDAACVYVNVATSFTDGGEFGLGAEIGISTQKLHARGPMGLEELTTYKWIIEGEGQIR
ncbi:MAG: glutamate-5-semialdehyde dehydrogenase [Phocaeicola sp.]